jgi:hypothetical protein
MLGLPEVGNDGLIGEFVSHLRRSVLMTDPETRPSVGKDVSSNLISSDKHSGKAIYGAEDKKIGSIECVMVDKSSGEPAYAVLSIGGILGMGSDHYPVPWRLLRYDSELDGYRSDISGNRLKGYPKSVFGSSGSELFDWTARRAELDSYYANIDEVTTKEGTQSPLTRDTG